ncbi:MAG: HAD-IA family hydrolase [Deltaproteobacteria bacterium]|nr:HAD-IA family hydrolase [Deltaproteobacteria bacterium]
MWNDVQAILFDCDGVMFDSREANRHYYNSILNHLGFPDMPDEDVGPVHMLTAWDSVKYIMRHHPESLPAAMKYLKTVDYAPFIQYMTMEPDLKEVLGYLRERYKTAVVSNRSTTLAGLLKLHGLNELFDVVVSALDVSRPKPDPEALNKALEAFRLTNRQAVYIGDSVIDEQASVQASVSLIAFRNPELEAEAHIDSLSELKRML